MNKTKIDWPFENLHTWNPITGCKHGCPYCYAKKIAMRFKGTFEPEFHEERLNDRGLSALEPRSIFVGSMSDMWGEWVAEAWIIKVLEVCAKNPQHVYIFLTKNPHRYIKFEKYFPENTWLGATVTGEKVGQWKTFMFETPKFVKKFLSIEPLLGTIEPIPPYVDRVIVGAMTGPGAVAPKREWIDSVKNAPNVYFKHGLK